MNYPPNAVDALHSLGFTDVSGVVPSNEEEYANLNIFSDDTPPTWKKVSERLAELKKNWDAQEYARNRAAEYPSIDELTVALYDEDDKTAIEAKRAAVKKKWPKDNSGPVE